MGGDRHRGSRTLVSDDGALARKGNERPAESTTALRVAMKKVATTLKGANVPFALSGGYASWARGGPEPSHDVDFVILAGRRPHALQVLEPRGCGSCSRRRTGWSRSTTAMRSST